MKQTITINSLKDIKNTKLKEDGSIDFEFEITKEMARKVLEESEEIQVGEEAYMRPVHGGVVVFSSDDLNLYSYFKEQDNLLSQKSYSKQQSKEYFDKRDARRAAEYRIKKAIEKMNGDKERDSEMVYNYYTHRLDFYSRNDRTTPKHLQFNHSIGDYMLEHHTEDYKIYFGIE